MAIHLILRALHEVTGELKGNILVYSDCRGALSKVRWLPSLQVPGSSRHADILKTILQARVHGSGICTYKHVKAHQDDVTGFNVLGCPAQLNCLIDTKAKQTILAALTGGAERQCQFPTEAITCQVGTLKVTSEVVGDIKFWVHRRLTWESLCTPTKQASSILSTKQFDEIAWEFVS